MPVTPNITIDTSRLEGTIEELENAFLGAMYQGMQRIVWKVAGDVKRKKMSLPDSQDFTGAGIGKQVLHVDTGRLRSSIQGAVVRDGQQGITGVIGSNVKYAPMQEFGGIIRPRRKKYLAYPVRGLKAGSPVHPLWGGAKKYIDSRGGIKNFAIFKGIIWEKTINTTLTYPFVFESEDKKLYPIFKLAKEVRIKEKRFIRDMIQEDYPEILSMLKTDMEKLLRSVMR